MADSPVALHHEGPAGLVYRSFDDFSRIDSPRQQNREDQCLVYYKNTQANKFPTLTLDLGKQYYLDNLQVISVSEATSDCSWLSSIYLEGLTVSTYATKYELRESNVCFVPTVLSLFQLADESKINQVPQAGVNMDSFASCSSEVVRYIALTRNSNSEIA